MTSGSADVPSAHREIEASPSCHEAGGTPAVLFRLLAWLSPAYPIGAFSYSHGLEYAIEAGLVREERQGRYVHYEVEPQGLLLLIRWLAKYRTYWPARVDALKALLKDMDQ